jgi:hypothetical protein
MGVLPIEAEIDRRILGLFRNILVNEDSVEAKIALRQLAVKNELSHSWFITVKNTLSKYDLPPAHSILQVLPTQSVWKRKVRSAISTYWNDKSTEELKILSSTRYLSSQSTCLHRPAPVWACTKKSLRDSHKARTKARVMCGVYRLQTHEAMQRQNQYRTSSCCLLCSKEPETRRHFLLACSALAFTRSPFLLKLDTLLMSAYGATPINREELLQLVIDPWHQSLPLWTQQENLRQSVEKISRDLIYALHLNRCRLIDNLPNSKVKKGKKNESLHNTNAGFPI